jgi:hypothetical protein
VTVFGCQPNRRWVLAFTLCGTSLRVWQFHRAGASGSTTLDIHDKPEGFLSVLTSYDPYQRAHPIHFARALCRLRTTPLNPAAAFVPAYARIPSFPSPGALSVARRNRGQLKSEKNVSRSVSGNVYDGQGDNAISTDGSETTNLPPGSHGQKLLVLPDNIPNPTAADVGSPGSPPPRPAASRGLPPMRHRNDDSCSETTNPHPGSRGQQLFVPPTDIPNPTAADVAEGDSIAAEHESGAYWDLEHHGGKCVGKRRD